MTSTNRWIASAVAVAGLFSAVAGNASTIGADESGSAQTVPQESIHTGTVSTVSVQRGVLVVGGVSYRIVADKVTYSDDRKKPASGGLAGLAAGDKVLIKSVLRDGTQHVVQLIVKD